MKKKNRYFKIITTLFLVGFILANIFLIIHTYKFTHYTNSLNTSKKNIEIGALFFGIDLPRPRNKVMPNTNYEIITLYCKEEKLNGWFIKTDSLCSKGTVVLAHGYNASKMTMLDRAMFFRNNGYNTLLFDFRGVGDSDGNQTTIGYREPENIKTIYEYLISKKEENVILFGTSMGSVAIMKAINDYTEYIRPKAIILECPYGTMLQTVKNRFKIMNLPEWIAYPFTFWGGFINGFNAFNLNPIDFAKTIDTPTLLIRGEKDNRVSKSEIDSIYKNLKGYKSIKTYLNSEHDDFLHKDSTKWKQDIIFFIENTKK